MRLLRACRVTVGVAFFLVVASLVAGSLLGQPILLSYVETGSMEPTLDPGDGFLAVPAQLAGPIQPGDVVVFQSEEIQGGRPTTHRVVRETDDGFVTRGDANPFTDQSNGEPPVKRAQVLAVVVRVDGEVVVVPNLGDGVKIVRSGLSVVQRTLAGLLGTRSLLGVQGIAYLFLALSLVWYAVGEWRASGTKDRDRDTTHDDGVATRLVVGGFTLLLVLGATSAMVVPAGTQSYGVVSAEFDSERPTVIRTGESATVEYPVVNGGVVPVVTFLDPASDGLRVEPGSMLVDGRATRNATVTLHAPPQTGYYRRFLVEHRYLALLPRSVITTLHGVHPWIPLVAVDAVIAVPFYLLGTTLLGGRVRHRSRNRGLSTATTVLRFVQQFYRADSNDQPSERTR